MRAQFERHEQALHSRGESDSVRVMRTTMRDMIRSFRRIECPFLKPEYQSGDSAHWSTNTPSEKATSYAHPYSYGANDEDEEDAQGLGCSNRFGNEYKNCGLKERWMWLRREQDVVGLSESLSRVEIRRTAYEVRHVMTMVCDIGRDVEDVRDAVGWMEGRMNRVVGIRRVD
jgi:hypothetical protein